MRGRHFTRLLAVLILTSTGLWAQEKQKLGDNPTTESTPETSVANHHPHIFHISLEDAARANPVAFSAASVAHGRKLFQTQCVMCHGQRGEGEGELPMKMKVRMPDFTRPETLGQRTDGELFAIQEVGSPVMPEQNYRQDREKWDIVNFLRSLSAKASGNYAKKKSVKEARLPKNR